MATLGATIDRLAQAGPGKINFSNGNLLLPLCLAPVAGLCLPHELADAVGRNHHPLYFKTGIALGRGKNFRDQADGLWPLPRTPSDSIRIPPSIVGGSCPVARGYARRGNRRDVLVLTPPEASGG